MKKICFVNPNSIFGKIGGAEVQIQILAIEAVKRNWDVYYITGPNELPKDNKTGIKFIVFRESGDIQKDVKNFKMLMDKINPDYIYQRGRKLWTYYAGEYAKNSESIFIFSTSMDIDCYKHKYLFRKPNSLREIYIRFKYWRTNLLSDQLTLKGINHADIILSQTKTQQYLLKKRLSLNSKVFPNIHNVPDHFIEKKSNSKPTILWMARLRSWKQPELFIQLANECKDLSCNFLMAGRLSESKYAKLIENESNKNPNFKYIGSVSFNKSNELLEHSDLFINTSRSEEGFPNTYIQAWLRKTPVITLNFDPDNVIETFELGEVAHSFKDLITFTKSYIQNASLRKSTGKVAQDFASKTYGIDQNIERFFKIIASE